MALKAGDCKYVKSLFEIIFLLRDPPAAGYYIQNPGYIVARPA